MHPTRRHRTAVLLAALALSPALAACGFSSQTLQVYDPKVGVQDRSGTVDILAAMIVSKDDGSGAFIASLANQSDTRDAKLTTVSGSGVQIQSRSITVPHGKLVNLADDGGLQVSGDDVKPGGYVKLRLEFSGGQTNDLDVPVVSAEGQFASISPSPSSSSSPSSSPSSSSSSSPSAGASGGAKPGKKPSPSDAATPSGSPTS